jgi:hypothetical protein
LSRTPAAAIGGAIIERRGPTDQVIVRNSVVSEMISAVWKQRPLA